MGVDPGLHTGVVWVDDACLDHIKASGLEKHGGVCEKCGYDEFIGRDRLGEMKMAEDIAVLIQRVNGTGDGDLDIIVIEDFILGHGQTRMHSAERSGLSPVRVTAMLEVWLHAILEYGGLVAYQQPSQAKGVITDSRLRSAGFWVPGSAHVRDAGRHLLLGLRRARAGQL